MGRKAQPLPADLVRVRTVFDRWRKSRRIRTRVPDELWDTAVPLARKHGVNRVSRALGVNYDGLKRRMALAVEKRRKAPSVATFVEINQPKVGDECVVELEDRRGGKMTIRLRGSSALDIVRLASAFLGRRR